MTTRSGVVLAGGQSRRFGSDDKALARLGGEPFLARVTDAVSPVVDEVVVSCRAAQIEEFEAVLPPGSVDEFVEDRFVDEGPLAGMEAALDVATGTYAAVVACDMPLVESATVETLFERGEGADGAVPRHADGRLEPLQAVYRAEAMREAALRLLPRGRSVRAALDVLDVRTVPAEQFPERTFRNVNTRQDLRAVERRHLTNRT